MSEKCAYCNKSVYAAERQLVNGKPFHFLCAGKFAEENKRAPVHNIAEEIHTGASSDPHYQNRETKKAGSDVAHTKMH